MKVQGKVVAVTGAGNGMGREVTLQLLKAGAKVAGVDIVEDALKETEKLAGGPNPNLSLHLVNIADQAAVAKLPAAVIKAHGQVDGIINVAGIIHKFKHVSELSYDDIHRVFNVNFFGTVHMVKEFLPVLVKRPEAQILNISSMGGYVPVPGQTMYGATKAAVKLFTEGLRSELAGTTVGVGLLFPGAIGTNMPVNSGVFTQKEVDAMSAQASKFKTMAPADAAARIIEAFEQNLFHGFAGSDAVMMDRLSRLMPEQAAKIIQKQMASLVL